MRPDAPEQPPTGRVRYTKRKPEGDFHVLYDRHEDGSEDFSERELMEVRWHPFQPSEGERQFARSLVAGGGTTAAGSPPVFDDRNESR
jgi:hypothetical protein